MSKPPLLLSITAVPPCKISMLFHELLYEIIRLLFVILSCLRIAGLITGNHHLKLEDDSDSSIEKAAIKSGNEDSVQATKGFVKLDFYIKLAILEYIPESFHLLCASGAIVSQELNADRFYQRKLAQIYMIPELANIDYHFDLRALDGVTFEPTEEGKMKTMEHLADRLATKFNRSPIRSNLTFLLYKKVIRPRLSEIQSLKPVYLKFNEPLVKSIFKSDVIDFITYSLFEARNFSNFLKCLLIEVYSCHIPCLPKIHKKWYENPKFMELFAEMRAKRPSEFKGLFLHLFNTLPNNLAAQVFNYLVKSQDGWDIILSGRDLPDFLIEAIFNYDSSKRRELEQRILESLRNDFMSQDAWEYCYCLKVRYNDPRNWSLTDPKGGSDMRVKAFIALGKFKEAVDHLIEMNFKFECIKFWTNKVDFHRFAIKNNLRWYKKHCDFSFDLVDYDPELVLKFYDFPSLEALFRDVLLDKERNRGRFWQSGKYPYEFFPDVFEMLYRNSMLDEFKVLLEMGFEFNNREVNLAALIDLKGHDHGEFMKYFSLISSCLRLLSWDLQLGDVHFEKLVSISGALECLFDRQMAVKVKDLAIFLHFYRAYVVLLDRKNNITIKFDENAGKISVSETVLWRLEKFIPSDEDRKKAFF